MTLYGRKVGKSSLIILIGSHSISRTMEPNTTWKYAEKDKAAVDIINITPPLMYTSVMSFYLPHILTLGGNSDKTQDRVDD